MTLSFMTKWPDTMPEHMAGKLNYFDFKIWMGLVQYGLCDSLEHFAYYKKRDQAAGGWWYESLPEAHSMRPKVHTIRFLSQKQAEIWAKPGREILFVINNRRPDRFQFAPVVKRTGVQRIEITKNDRSVKIYSSSSYEGPVVIKIDGRALEHGEKRALAINDGFENLDDLASYFTPDSIQAAKTLGKEPYLIHWANFKY